VPVWSIRPSLNVLDRLWAWLGIYTDVVAVSEGVRASCRGYPARLMRRTVVVHNGLFGWRASALGRDEARRRLGIAPERLALVAVGRLAAQKNYPLMLRVMQKLDDAVLLIAGDGPDGAALAHAATTLGVADRVRFLGAVERSAIPDLLAAADVFVQPSTFEGQSNAILEALQAGLPIVAHDIPEQRETIADPDGTSAGALVPLGDVDAWAAAIERLRVDRAAMQAAREVARRRARLFGFDRMVAGFEKVLIA
jgi:glycosyltransferase involved in cell wall biosynthesis